MVRTEETLTGVEFSREVVERCRRVRKADTAPERKLVDCGPNGCTAWIQVLYTKETQEAECRRFSDENFADPAACQSTIEAFKNTAGYSAASFRERVRLVDDAISQCAEIDVRPTPLMQSLGEKLEVGMTTFRKGAPGYLKNYWLADYAPMWQQLKESDRFVARLQLLRAYLAHKVLVMDVIEASTLDEVQQDTPEAMTALLEVMKKVTRDQAFGTEDIHLFAVDRLGQMHRRGHLTADTAAINGFIREHYPPAELVAWGKFRGVIKLFAFDGTIDDAEWAFGRGMRDWKRAASELLKTTHHGAPGTRLRRLRDSVELALKDARDTDRFRAFKAVICWTSCADLVLDVEQHLPADIRAGYDWSFLYDVFHRTDDDMSKADFDRFMARMVRALAEEDDEKKTCTGLSGRLEKIEAYEFPTDSVDSLICRCLRWMKDGTKVLVNKSELYDRAVDRNLTCVQPAS